MVGAACYSAGDTGPAAEDDASTPAAGVGTSAPTSDLLPVPESIDPFSAASRLTSGAGQSGDGFEYGYGGLLPRDAIRPIYEPTIATPDQVPFDPDDLVIGVSVADESRAYPISTLRFREIVNDELGGVPILVTW